MLLARANLVFRRQAVFIKRFPSLTFMTPNMHTEAGPATDLQENGIKRKHPAGYRFKNKKRKKASSLDLNDGSHDSVLHFDVQNLLLALVNEKDNGLATVSNVLPPERGTELELDIADLSSTGDGLALHKPSGHVIVVPYTVPGDKVKAVLKRTGDDEHSFADLVSVIHSSVDRHDDMIRCPYFARCSGCQFQMMSYDYQLLHKKTIVAKAFRNFSNLPQDAIPEIGDTIDSPLEYGYRTKLTPHFDGPPGKRSDRRNGIRHSFKEVPPIGFMLKGSRTTIDIEDCPIGTDAVRVGMKRERKRIADELQTFSRGATVLLRESTHRVQESDDVPASSSHEISSGASGPVKSFREIKTCVSDPNDETTEYIGDFVLTNRAGAFFQNNNSILPRFTQYVRDQVQGTAETGKLNYLIDAYCGSGLFSVVLASLFTKTIGIDIAHSSIQSAARNAELNGIAAANAEFICADAKDLFASVKFPSEETVVVVDPPRKGCDEDFLRQLSSYAPKRVVYVSCNVHTQARDVGALVKGLYGEVKYEIESLRGFDFFPQTGHVEGVAVLNRVDPSGD